MLENTPEKEIINSWLEKSKHQLVIVVFSCLWSGSTHILRTYLKSIVEEFSQVEKIIVDIEEQERIAAEFDITQIPTMVIMKEGAIIDTVVGTMAKKKLRALIAGYL